MTPRTSAVRSSVIAFLLTSTAASADVTAEQVWDAWTKQYAAYGYTFSDAGTRRDGATLVIDDLVLKQEVEGSSFDMTIPEVRLREMGDGTVEVTFSDEIKGVATSKVEERPEMSMNILVRQADAITIVSGTPEALSYAVTAPEITVEVDQVASGDQPGAPVKIWGSVQGTTGEYRVTGAAQEQVESNFRISGMKFTASGADPESGGTFALDGQVSDLKVKSATTTPEGVSFEDMPAALAAGAKVSVDATYGASSISVEAMQDDSETKIDMKAQSGRFNFALTPENALYSVSAANETFEMTSAQMPFPVSGQMESANFDIAVPLAAAETPQPFSGKIGLVGLNVSDQLWSMFDPQALLPRDPATLIIDLEGEAKPLMALYSPEASAAQMPPVELDSLKINQVRLALAGAEVAGKGDLTFDNASPMPMPVGAIDLNLNGVKGLMDKLVTMGLLPQDQAMFGQMMLGLYAVSNGEDSMSSKIEFKEGGQILANGQRIQ